jgi:hypothetical protein
MEQDEERGGRIKHEVYGHQPASLLQGGDKKEERCRGYELQIGRTLLAGERICEVYGRSHYEITTYPEGSVVPAVDEHFDKDKQGEEDQRINPEEGMQGQKTFHRRFFPGKIRQNPVQKVGLNGGKN